MSKNKTISSVVAKALVTQLQSEVRDERKKQVPFIKKQIENSAEFKRMKSLYDQANKLSEQANKIRNNIQNMQRNGFSVSVYSGSVNVRETHIQTDEKKVISDIILMSHNDMPFDKIKSAIKTKYFGK